MIVNRVEGIMLKSNANIEVKITYERKRYKAVCMAFPQCKGFGKTEAIALRSLSRDISKLVMKSSETAFKSIFLSAHHTSIIIQNRKKHREIQRVYHLEAAAQAFWQEIQDHYLDLHQEAPQSMMRLQTGAPGMSKMHSDLALTLYQAIYQSKDNSNGFGYTISLN